MEKGRDAGFSLTSKRHKCQLKEILFWAEKRVVGVAVHELLCPPRRVSKRQLSRGHRGERLGSRRENTGSGIIPGLRERKGELTLGARRSRTSHETPMTRNQTGSSRRKRVYQTAKTLAAAAWGGKKTPKPFYRYTG